jgi:hypothetical protein
MKYCSKYLIPIFSTIEYYLVFFKTNGLHKLNIFYKQNEHYIAHKYRYAEF